MADTMKAFCLTHRPIIDGNGNTGVITDCLYADLEGNPMSSRLQGRHTEASAKAWLEMTRRNVPPILLPTETLQS